MLHPFVSASVARRPPGFGGLASSVSVHAAIVGFTVVAQTALYAPVRSPGLRGVEHVVFTGIMPSEATRHVRSVPSAAVRRGGRGTARTRPRTVARPVRIDALAFELDDATEAALAAVASLDVAAAGPSLAARASEGIGFDRALIEQLRGMPRPVALAAYGAYAESAVEKVVAPFGTNPRPRYPASLQAAAVEEDLIVRFVVDSTGRVDRRSLTFPGSAHRLFVKSVRDALVRSRYIPAELAGRRVAQLVQQRFSFVLERR